MFQENELMTLLMGVGGVLFLFLNRRILKSIPSHRILLLAFFFSMMAWLFTVLEGFILPYALDVIEHAFYSIGSFFILLWIWIVFGRKETFK